MPPPATDHRGTPRLRVLYSFPHPLGDPGIGTTAINQVRGLHAAGQSVTVMTTSVAAPLPDGVDVHRTMSLGRRRVPHRAIGVERAYRYHDAMVARFLRRHADDFDVVHTWPRSCLATLAAARAAGIAGFRESPSPHTADAFEDAARAAASVGLSVPGGHSHDADPQRLRTEEAEYEAADFILSPSDFVVDSYRRRGIDPAKLVRHRYGFDPAHFPLPPALEPRRGFTAVFVGNGEPHKGLHHALAAWRRAAVGPDSRLLVIGRIEPRFRELLAEYFDASNRVVELGFRRDVGSHLRGCDTLLLPSTSEGSALVTFEAMASGTVPLVSDATGSPVRHDVDGLIHTAGDVDMLTGHIERLHDQPDVQARLRAAGVARRHELSWDSAGQRLAAAYRVGLARVGNPIVGIGSR